jgi:hypothetical protein
MPIKNNRTAWRRRERLLAVIPVATTGLPEALEPSHIKTASELFNRLRYRPKPDPKVTQWPHYRACPSAFALMAVEGIFEREKDPVRNAMGMELSDSDFSERGTPPARPWNVDAGRPAGR